MVEHTRAVGLNAKSHRIWTPANKIRTNEGSAYPALLGQAIRNTSSAIFPGVIREIEIWRVAVLMVNRYVDEAERRIASGVPRSQRRKAITLGRLSGVESLSRSSSLPTRRDH